MGDLEAGEALARVTAEVQAREDGLQKDRRHCEIGHEKWTEERVAKERAYATVPGLRLDDMQAILSALSNTREAALEEALQALHARLPYPTEACAIVRALKATGEGR